MNRWQMYLLQWFFKEGPTGLSQSWASSLINSGTVWRVFETNCCTGGVGPIWSQYCDLQECMWSNGTVSEREIQRQLHKEIEEWNWKDKLYNHLRSYCEEHGFVWKADQVDMLWVSFLWCICDVLWYIDGHNHIFASWGCKIPELFTQFDGYNIPELLNIASEWQATCLLMY